MYRTRPSSRRHCAIIAASVVPTTEQGVSATQRLSDGHAQSSVAEIQARMSEGKQICSRASRTTFLRGNMCMHVRVCARACLSASYVCLYLYNFCVFLFVCICEDVLSSISMCVFFTNNNEA